jgi:hypothetical protein
VVWLCLPLFAVRPVCDVLSSPVCCCCCGCVFAIHTQQHWRRPGILPPFSVDWTDLPSLPHKKFVDVVVVLLLFYDVYDDWRCHTSCLFRLCVYLFLGDAFEEMWCAWFDFMMARNQRHSGEGI